MCMYSYNCYQIHLNLETIFHHPINMSLSYSVIKENGLITGPIYEVSHEDYQYFTVYNLKFIFDHF